MAMKKTLGNITLIMTIAWLTLRFMKNRESFDTDALVRGKNVIVTGASTGIGRATALRFCEMGANVVITARTASKLEKVLEECATRDADPRRIRGYVTADMSDMDSASSVILRGVELLGGIDYLILNHVMVDESMFDFFDHSGKGYEVFRKMFDINFFSYVKITDVAMPYLMKSNGRVAVISSVVGRSSDILSTMYGATKHAMDGFFQSLDLEHHFRLTNVSFTVMMVGPVDTWTEKKHDFEGPKFEERMRHFQEDLKVDFMKLFIRYGFNPGTPQGCADAIIRATALRHVEGWYRDDIFQWGPQCLKIMFPEMTRYFITWAKSTTSNNN